MPSSIRAAISFRSGREGSASKLRIGMAAEISLPALGSAPVTATISEIDGRANQATGAFTVQFSLPSSAQLKSGQIGSLLTC